MKRLYTPLVVTPVILLAPCIFLPSAVKADTNVSGDITTNTTWGATRISSNIVQGRVTVDSGATLTIDAGVPVKFNAGPIGITVSGGGILKVNGASTNTVTFTADDAWPYRGYWDTIKVNSSASTTFANANISYGGSRGNFFSDTEISKAVIQVENYMM
jgi:hypothetical protein